MEAGRESALMHGAGPADFAPNLDAVFARRNACDVDARSARALHDVLHGCSEPAVLHELNASIPCNGRLEHHETSRRREPFDFRNTGRTRRPTGRMDQLIQSIDTPVKAVAFHDGPAPQEARAGAIEQRKKIGEVFKTVVGEVDEDRLGAAAQRGFVFPSPCVHANDFCWQQRSFSF